VCNAHVYIVNTSLHLSFDTLSISIKSGGIPNCFTRVRARVCARVCNLNVCTGAGTRRLVAERSLRSLAHKNKIAIGFDRADGPL